MKDPVKDPVRREERARLLKKVCVTLAVMGAYYLFVRITGLSIPCVFHEVTGLRCPGCGVTHMMMHLAKLEIHEAFMSNPLLFFLLPVFCLLLAVKLIFMPAFLESRSKPYRIGERICLAAVLVFWLVRNIIGI